MRKTHVSADGSGSSGSTHQITENAWVQNTVHSPQIICPSDPYQFNKISPQISTPRPVADFMMKIQRFIIVEKPRGYSGTVHLLIQFLDGYLILRLEIYWFLNEDNLFSLIKHLRRVCCWILTSCQPHTPIRSPQVAVPGQIVSSVFDFLFFRTCSELV